MLVLAIFFEIIIVTEYFPAIYRKTPGWAMSFMDLTYWPGSMSLSTNNVTKVDATFKECLLHVQE